MTALWLEQARALFGLRVKLWWRRMVQERRWGRAAMAVFAAAAGAIFSFALCVLIDDAGRDLERDPASLAARGGALAVFATWLTMALVGRVWFALMAAGQQSFLDPRRFRSFPVSSRLVSLINLVALFVEPVWLVIYPPLVVAALAISRLPGAPALWGLLVAEAFAVWATVGVLHAGAALGAAFDARPLLRRGFSIALVIAGFAGFQLSIAMPGRPGLAALFAGHHWRAIAWTPPGWTALLARELSDGRPLHALTPMLLLFLLGLFCSIAAHALSQREAIRPPEPVQASGARGSGWRLPLVSATFSALFEKEAKTVVRIGWLQLVLVPVAYLLAHLGVLESATNAFGRDVGAARAYFLWPVSLRGLLAAKNAVAYCFSAAIFLLLAVVAWTSARVTADQVAVAFLAHAAIFPLLATLGNATSVLFPMPVRGARLRRVRGAGPIGARLVALGMLAGAAWAPWWIAQVTGVHLFAAYAGALLAMSIAYLGLLGACAHLLQSRRESLLNALARDE